MKILAAPAFKNRRANPYNAALYSAVEAAGATVGEFSKLRVLFGRWDILHLHWPEGPLHAKSGVKAAVIAAYHLLRLAYARSRGAKIVWTVHNLASHHTAHPKLERWFWKTFIPLTDATIHLSRSGLELARQKFPALAEKPHSVIPHGHYRDCYTNDSDWASAREALGLAPDRSVIAFVGQIKPYKNVPALARAFAGTTEPHSTLLVAGKPGDAAIETELQQLARNDSRLVCRLGLIPEESMQHYLNACDLAVFPYREILNSGSAILALSFNRPVLVPARGAMAELREAIGSEWVMTYEGELTSDILREALRWAEETPRPATCDLAPLEWEAIAQKTLNAYETVGQPRPVVATTTAPEGAPS
jgi:glycosyltransferase involved in cell wall biosynthesis